MSNIDKYKSKASKCNIYLYVQSKYMTTATHVLDIH